jgi:hypothetical protein
MTAFLRCGDLHEGFARVRCGDCGHEMFVARKYMTRCPFSLSRLVKVTQTGQVIYKAEKDVCRAFPDPQGNDLAPGRAPSRSDGRRPVASVVTASTAAWRRLGLRPRRRRLGEPDAHFRRALHELATTRMLPNICDCPLVYNLLPRPD